MAVNVCFNQTYFYCSKKVLPCVFVSVNLIMLTEHTMLYYYIRQPSQLNHHTDTPISQKTVTTYKHTHISHLKLLFFFLIFWPNHRRSSSSFFFCYEHLTHYTFRCMRLIFTIDVNLENSRVVDYLLSISFVHISRKLIPLDFLL